ncbi:MAG: hypothetical protein AAFZ67_14575, partial [Planctomycetota bacterium]
MPSTRSDSRPATLLDLRSSGWNSKPLREEMRSNLVRHLERARDSGEPLLQGSWATKTLLSLS